MKFNAVNKNHLLLITNDQEKSRQMFLNYIKCLLFAKSRDSEFSTVSPFIFLCDHKIQTRKADKNDLLLELSNGTEDIFYAKNSKGISEALNTLYEEFQQREEDSDNINQPLFLFLFGLQNMDRILETFDGETDFDMEDPFAMDDNCGSKKSPGQIFRILLQKGSQRNIFIVTWMDNAQSVKKLEFGDVEYFGNKVLGKMSSAESDALIDSSTAGTLNETQLVYSNLNSEIQKLKIYQ